jgi:hypothetical protein
MRQASAWAAGRGVCFAACAWRFLPSLRASTDTTSIGRSSLAAWSTCGLAFFRASANLMAPMAGSRCGTRDSCPILAHPSRSTAKTRIVLIPEPQCAHHSDQVTHAGRVVAQGAIRRLTIWSTSAAHLAILVAGCSWLTRPHTLPLTACSCGKADIKVWALRQAQSEAVAWSPACQVFFACCRQMLHNGMLCYRRPMRSGYLQFAVQQLHLKRRGTGLDDELNTAIQRLFSSFF